MECDVTVWPATTRVRLGVVVSCLVALVLLTPDRPVFRGLFAPLEAATAEVTARLVEATALDVRRDGTTLSNPAGFAYRIYWRCTGLLPAVFLCGLVVASPGRRREKWIGAAAGVLVVLVANQVRLVHLFHVGVRNPASFHVVHSVVWEGVTVGVVLGAWLGWLRWSAACARDRSC